MSRCYYVEFMNDTNTVIDSRQSSISYTIHDGKAGMAYTMMHIKTDSVCLTLNDGRKDISYESVDCEVSDECMADRYGFSRMKAVRFKWPRGAKRIELRSCLKYGAKELAVDVAEWKARELKG